LTLKRIPIKIIVINAFILEFFFHKRICKKIKKLKKLEITLKNRNRKLKKNKNQKNYRLIKILFGTVPFLPWAKFALWFHLEVPQTNSKKFSKCLF
jgi:hypothetical protein